MKEETYKIKLRCCNCFHDFEWDIKKGVLALDSTFGTKKEVEGDNGLIPCTKCGCNERIIKRIE